MNEETNEFLRDNLEEAHSTFKSILLEMKQNNILIDYKELEREELLSYQEIINIMKKMNYYVNRANILEDDKKEILDIEYKIYLKYFSLYVISIVFIRVFLEIYDTSKLSELLKYIIGIFLGSTYISLLSKDINDNRTDSKDKRDLINELKTLKEEYKIAHDKVVCEIDGIFALTDSLWNKLDREKMLIKYR